MTGAAREEGSRRTPRRARFRAPGSLERPRIRGHSEHQGDSSEHHAGRDGEPGGQSQKPQQVFHACLPFGVLEGIGDPAPAPRAARRWQRAEQFWQSDGRRLDALPMGYIRPRCHAALPSSRTTPPSAPITLKRCASMASRWRRTPHPQAAEERLERGALQLDLKRFSVTWRGTAVALTLTEFWMVHALCKFPEHVKSREQLMREANLVVDEGTITSHVKRIRRKFLAADPRFDAIDTVYGMGYRWKA